MATYNGTRGNDVYNGTSDDDVIRGGMGGDTLRGGLGNDEIHGDDGNDRLEGQDGADRLYGGKGEDVLDGGSGNDQLDGGVGEDILNGGSGHDRLTGGVGNDRLDGGDGTDTAYYAGRASDYQVTTVDGVTTVRDLKPKTNGDDGTDTLVAVERIRFSDGTTIFLTPNAAPTAPTDADAAPNSVAEGAAAGTLVGIQASSTDPDEDAVTYALVLSDGTTVVLNDGRFAIDPNSGVVSVHSSAALDYETATGHTITVRATDAFGAYTEQTFTIAVTNVAPSTPSDTDGSAGGGISEGAANGDTVGITASSSDVNGGTVTYSLTDDAGGRFAIDPATGVVTVLDATLLDYEDATSHQITVEASDGTDTSSQSFTIAVGNVAPAAPTDTDGDPGATVAEDLAVGSAVGITASSSDVNGGTVDYYFRDGDGNRVQTLGGFTVNASSGVVTLAAALDYESATSHALTIYAGDGTGETSSVFTVNVTNVSEAAFIPVGLVTSQMQLFLGFEDSNSDGVEDGFADSVTLPGGEQSHQIAYGDFDGDGDIDFLNSSFLQSNAYLYLNTGDANSDGVPEFTRHAISNPTPVWSVLAADVDKDGDLDVVVGSTHGNADTVLVNQGDTNSDNVPNFQAVTLGSAGSGFSYGNAVGDLNGDGITDLVFTEFYYGPVQIHYGLGDTNLDGLPEFAAPVTAPQANGSGFGAISVEIADIDGDGDQDIIGTTWGGYRFIDYNLGDTNGDSRPDFQMQILPNGAHSFEIIARDIDGDSDLDLISTGDAGGTTNIYYNDGDTNSDGLLEFRVQSFGFGSWHVDAGDWDDDGDLDLAFSHWNGVTLLEQTGVSGGFVNFTQAVVPVTENNWSMDIALLPDLL